MKKKTYFNLLTGLGALTLSGTLVSLSSCNKDESSKEIDKVDIKWIDNKNTLDANNNITSIQAIATLNINGTINPVVNNWDCERLPAYIHKVVNRNSIIFTLDTGVSHQAHSFKVFAMYNNLKSNELTFQIKQHTAINYENEIVLTSTDDAKTLTQSRKQITLTATIRKISDQTSVSGNVTWNLGSLPGFIESPINTASNTLVFKLKDNEETIAGQYAIQASFNPTQPSGAATQEFILETEDWYHWESDWIPKSAFIIDSKGILKGFNSGVDLSNFDTLHIPREVKGISANAFMSANGASYETKIPSNIVNIDFSAATQLTSIGANTFYKAPFANSLVLPSNVNFIGENAFYYCQGITSIDLSNCSHLLSLAQGTFASCDSITNILFNDNLEMLGSTTAGAGSGVFEMSMSGNRHWSSPILKLPRNLKKIGSGTFNNLNAGSATLITIDWNGITNLKEMGKGAFGTIWFQLNSEITIPNGVEKLGVITGMGGTGGSVFLYSRNIKKVTLPSSVTTIAPNALGDIYNNGGSSSGYSLSEVVIKNESNIYQYNDTANTTGTNFFDNWLRPGLIDKGHNINCDSSAKLYVPQSLYSQYISAYPTSMQNAITAYTPSP